MKFLDPLNDCQLLKDFAAWRYLVYHLEQLGILFGSPEGTHRSLRNTVLEEAYLRFTFNPYSPNTECTASCTFLNL
jgi:hypothetical protein